MADLWWQKETDEVAGAVVGTCDSLERIQSARRDRARRNIELYEGKRLDGLSPEAFFSRVDFSCPDFDVLRANIARGLVHTALAKIAGKQKPKAQFVVTDGDWSVKRRAKRLERFTEAQMLAPQGGLHDAWSVGVQAYRDACVTDLGVLHVEADNIEKKVNIRRVLPWEILIDPNEARTGEPLNLFRVYPYDRSKLAARFPKHKAAILAAPPIARESGASDWYQGTHDTSHMVLVREAWRLPYGEVKGRHVIAIGGSLGAALVDEEWSRKSFPFEFLVWEPWMVGMHGTSLVDNVYHLVIELNASAQRMSDAERLASNVIIQAEEGMINEEDVTSNTPATIVWRKPGAAELNIMAPNAISSSTLQWWELLRAQCFEIPGVSQANATGAKEPGVDAAIAMRTRESLSSERFSVQWQHYERVMSIGLTRQILACVEELAADEPKFAAKWPGGEFLQEIRWKECRLDDNQYHIQPYSVSGLVNTPTDRLQLASELFDRQILSQEGFLRVIQAKDIDTELARTNTQSRLLERYIEQWLDADEDKEADGDFRYKAPIKWMALEEAIVQVGRAYLEAELNEAPDYNLSLFIRYLQDCDALVQRVAAQKAQLAAMAGGAPPVPPPGGAPPMPPGAPPPGMA